MTAPFEISVEAEAVEASHLVRVPCASCAARDPWARVVWTLADPGRPRESVRCAKCHGGSQIVATGSMAYGVPVGYPNPYGRGSVALSGPEEYPAPVVSSRDERWVDVAGVPGPVDALAERARAAGWDVRVQYARGCFANRATGRPGAVKDSFAVVFRRDGWGGYAVRVGAVWESVLVYGRALPWFPHASITDLGTWLADPERPAAWYDEIRARESAKKTRQREAAKLRTKKGGEGL